MGRDQAASERRSLARAVADGRTTWAKRSDFRVVNGLRFVFRQETGGETARQAQMVPWEKVTVNGGLEEVRFARPSRAASVVRLNSGRTATDWLAVDLHPEAPGLSPRRGHRPRHRHRPRLGSGNDRSRQRAREAAGPPRRGRARSAGHRGNLGANILSRFRIVFDYSRSCLWLEPGLDLGAPFPKDESGRFLQWADGEGGDGGSSHPRGRDGGESGAEGVLQNPARAATARA
jgi:hypothetical protein